MAGAGQADSRAAGEAIREASLAILRSRIDLVALPPLCRAVTERVIHASADPAYAEDLVLDEHSLEAGVAALRDGAGVVADTGMTATGVRGGRAVTYLADPRVAGLAAAEGITRSAAGVRLAALEVGPGAVWVVGAAPTAVLEVLDHALRPALVVALPPGFVGAVEAKAALRASGLPAVTNRSERGGSGPAVAAVNALLGMAT